MIHGQGSFSHCLCGKTANKTWVKPIFELMCSNCGFEGDKIKHRTCKETVAGRKGLLSASFELQGNNSPGYPQPAKLGSTNDVFPTN